MRGAFFTLSCLALAGCGSGASPADENAAAEPAPAAEAREAGPEPPESGTPTGDIAGGEDDGAPPSDLAPIFPAALRGIWRETTGNAAASAPAQCDKTRAANMGKVLTVRETSYSYFETGGRFIAVSQRNDGAVRAVFDTTYADMPTRDELTFAVDPVARTLTVTNHDAGEAGSRIYKRCP